MDSSPHDLTTWPGILAALGVAGAAGLMWIVGQWKKSPAPEQITPSAQAVIDASVARALADRHKAEQAEEFRLQHERDLGAIRNSTQAAISDVRGKFFERFDELSAEVQQLRERVAVLEDRTGGRGRRRGVTGS